MKKKCEHTHRTSIIWMLGTLFEVDCYSCDISLSLPVYHFLRFSRSHNTRLLSEFQSYPPEMSEKCHSKQFQMSSSSMLLYLTIFTSRSFHFVPFIYHSISNRDTVYWRKYVKWEKPKCCSSSSNRIEAAYFIQSLEGLQCSSDFQITLNRNQTRTTPKNFITTHLIQEYVNLVSNGRKGVRPVSMCCVCVCVRLRVCYSYLFSQTSLMLIVLV